MKVYFSGSNHRLEDDIDKYRNITGTIKNLGHTITRDWIEDDFTRKRKLQTYSLDDYRVIWSEVKESILQSDVAIFDVSENSYSIGYQTAFALSNKKPTLVLSDNQRISRTIIIGEDNPLLTIAQYKTESLRYIIESFLLKFSSSKQDLRFNMLLNRETQVFLELESYRTGRPKAKIIRDLLSDAIRSKNGL